MATITYVRKMLRKLIDQEGLTVNSSPRRVMNAVSEKYSVFPQWVKAPEYNSTTGKEEWVKNHRWGEGPNESPTALYRICGEILLEDAGLNPQMGFDNVKKHGLANVQAIQTTLKKTISPRGAGSPYTQDYAAEYEVAARIGAERLLEIHSSMNWKGWAESIRWMSTNPGYEVLSPWSYLFGERSKYDPEKGDYVYFEALEANWAARDAVWEYSRWATHNEMARIISILCREEFEFGFADIFRMITTHKSWKERDNWQAEVEYIRWLLDSVDNLDAFAKLQIWDSDQYGRRPSILSFLRDTLFGWGFTDEVRAQFLQAVQQFGFEVAWESIIDRANTQLSHQERAEMMTEAAQKLGADTVILFLAGTPDDQNAKSDWYHKFAKLVGWYQKVEDQQFNSFSEFEKVAIIDSWGEQPKSWMAQLAAITDDEFAWQYFRQAIDTAEGGWSYETKVAKGTQRLGFVPSMVQKLNPVSIHNIVTTEHQYSDLAKLVGWINIRLDVEFASYEEFEKEAILDSWGAEARTWLGQLAELMGEDFAWGVFHGTLVAQPNFKAFGISSDSYEDRVRKGLGILKFVPQLFNKFQPDTAVMLLQAGAANIPQLSRLVIAYKPQAGDTFAGYTQFMRRATKDGWGEQINKWFDELVRYIKDEELVWDYFTGSGDSGHDAFFFVTNMVAKLDAYSVRQIISQVDNTTLRALATTVDAYQKEDIRFDGWRAFKKHVDLQKNRIVIPNDDPKIAAAVEVMLQAPGLSISDLKNELKKPRFQALARGEMDADALLQPAVKMYYLTPAHELVRTALGFAGKADGYRELRIKLARLVARFYERQVANYNRIPEEERVGIQRPILPNLTVAIPDEMDKQVGELLAEHKVDVRSFHTPEQAVKYAIGVMPKAENDRGLYTKLNQLAKTVGLQTIDLMEHVPAKLEESVWRLLEEHNCPMGQAYKAEILAKSDPRGWVGGNWVVCCASFGQAKNWDYMYNRACSYQIVSLCDPQNNTERIISWSVVVATARKGKSFDIKTVTVADVEAWTLDNIEGNKNHNRHFKSVEAVTARFWKSITTKRVMVGAWHNDLVPTGAYHVASKSIRNEWIPMQIMSYSDFFGASECDTWVLQEGTVEAQLVS